MCPKSWEISKERHFKDTDRALNIQLRSLMVVFSSTVIRIVFRKRNLPGNNI